MTCKARREDACAFRSPKRHCVKCFKRQNCQKMPYPAGVKINAMQAGAFLAALGVMLGAFGAHALKTRLDASMLANFETGVRYQMYAALALMVLGTQVNQTRAPMLILLGALVFSGSLYLLAVTGVKILGAITPIGGVLMIAGLILAALDTRK